MDSADLIRLIRKLVAALHDEEGYCRLCDQPVFPVGHQEDCPANGPVREAIERGWVSIGKGPPPRPAGIPEAK